MSWHPDRPSFSVQDVYILLLYSISFALGATALWLYQNYPLSNSKITIFRIIPVAAAALTVALTMGAIFLGLTRLMVIDPIRKELEEATVTYDGEEVRFNPEAVPDDFDIPPAILDHLGYTNISDSPGTQDSITSDDDR